jgi:hypothetical protein
MDGSFFDGAIGQALIVIVVLALVAGTIIFAIKTMRRQAAKPAPRELPGIATIVETTTLTVGGSVALILLVLHNIGVAGFSAKALSAVQEAALGTFWIGGNILWGIGIIVGRKRRYTVYRQDDAGGV